MSFKLIAEVPPFRISLRTGNFDMIRRIALILLLAGAMLPALAEEASNRPKVGELPPPALGNDRNGKEVNLDALHGKVVVLTFWASWCGYCRQELPMLAHMQKIVGHDNLEVIAINFKESKQEFLSVIRANKGLDLTYVQDSKGKVSDRYGVEGLPNMFILDRDGKIAYWHAGYDEGVMQTVVQEMLSLLPQEALQKPASSP
jgi:thiol-disulfide isomerase/thioredoxin